MHRARLAVMVPVSRPPSSLMLDDVVGLQFELELAAQHLVAHAVRSVPDDVSLVIRCVPSGHEYRRACCGLT